MATCRAEAAHDQAHPGVDHLDERLFLTIRRRAGEAACRAAAPRAGVAAHRVQRREHHSAEVVAPDSGADIDDAGHAVKGEAEPRLSPAVAAAQPFPEAVADSASSGCDRSEAAQLTAGARCGPLGQHDAATAGAQK